MKRVILSDKMKIQANQDIMCMANLRGDKVKVPHSLNFSFYFSTYDGVNHGIRVKPVFNPHKLSADSVGTLMLCDEWEFTPGQGEKHISSKDINAMKQFFIDYKVLFAAVWEKELQEDDVQDYFRGNIELSELIESFSFYRQCEDVLSEVTNVAELEDVVRTLNLFNMND